MPYINKEKRHVIDGLRIDDGDQIATPGELNYAITNLIDSYLLGQNKNVGYTKLNEVVGVLECAKQEFYSRILCPYEDVKREQHGDVYYADLYPGYGDTVDC